jgi:hypothetical protein
MTERAPVWTLEQSIAMLGDDHAGQALMGADLARAAQYLDERVAWAEELRRRVAEFAARFWEGAS